MDFADALNVDVSTIERPPAAPAGHYRFKVTKYAFGQIKSKKTGLEWDTIDFNCQGVEPGEDVNTADLSTFGGIEAVRGQIRFMFPKGDGEEAEAGRAKTLWGIKRFLIEHCGLEDKGKLRALVDSSKGSEFMGSGEQQPDENDPEVKYFRIVRTAPV